MTEKPGTPSMAISDIAGSLAAAVAAAVNCKDDIRAVGGEIH